MDSLAQMQLFLNVAKAGSFSAAGRVVGMSTSSVSRKIAALEDDLGLNLFLRGGHELGLTEAGAYYHERALALVEEMEQARLAVRSFQEKPRGLIRITAVVQFVESFLWRILPDFFAAYPDIRVELRLDDRYSNLVRENIDLAFRIGNLEDSSLIAKRIASNEMRMVATPAYLGQYGEPKTPEDLKHHQFVTYWNQKVFDTWQWWDGDLCHKFKFTAKVQTNSGQVMLDAALAGLGITVLPYWYLAEYIHDGRVVCLLESFRPEYPELAGGSIYAIYPHTPVLPPKVRVFLDFAVARFQAALRQREPARIKRPQSGRVRQPGVSTPGKGETEK